jgi:predicted DNA-binding protein YlxM (UPF0122 family)
MSSILYGSLRFDRASIPAELRLTEVWPSADPSALSDKDRKTYDARVQAIELFIAEHPLSLTEICKRTGIAPKEIYRHFNRCIETHSDGRINGYRALLPYELRKPYQRTAAVTNNSKRAAGAFAQLVNRYSELANWLKALVAKRAKDNKKPDVRIIGRLTKDIHRSFLDRCRKAGIKPTEYPFNQDLLGIRSLSTYLKKLAQEHLSFVDQANYLGADHVGGMPTIESFGIPLPAAKPYHAVEFDGHRIDLRLSISIKDPFGYETILEIERIWILAIIEVVTRAILGYSLVIGGENYSKDDVESAIEDALMPHQPRSLTIPGLTYANAGGFPSAKFPACSYRCWSWFRFDNAKAHLAKETLRRLNKVVGCISHAGEIGNPDGRPFIERFFGYLARNFSQRITGTTGSNPLDVQRILADPGSDHSLLMTLEELEELIDVVVSDYNGESHSGIGGRTPLEAMSYHLQKSGGLVRCLPIHVQRNLFLLHEAKIVPVKGSVEKGVRPHVNFENVRYTSDILAGNGALIGKRLRVYFDTKDLRTLRAFFEDGQELGVLIAARPWSTIKHSMATRKAIFRLIRIGKLRYREGQSVLEAYAEYRRKKAIKTKSRKAATKLAKLQKESITSAIGTTSDAPLELEFPSKPVRSPSSAKDDCKASVESRLPSMKYAPKRKTVVF